mmetsp:Transcript_2239/g.6959  ORF Transcript_2239/g.6959 Transcript_2239/m.6959 type:complete len:204 (+) Transcript_2239:142-753(+)
MKRALGGFLLCVVGGVVALRALPLQPVSAASFASAKLSPHLAHPSDTAGMYASRHSSVVRAGSSRRRATPGIGAKTGASAGAALRWTAPASTPSRTGTGSSAAGPATNESTYTSHVLAASATAIDCPGFSRFRSLKAPPPRGAQEPSSSSNGFGSAPSKRVLAKRYVAPSGTKNDDGKRNQSRPRHTTVSVDADEADAEGIRR